MKCEICKMDEGTQRIGDGRVCCAECFGYIENKRNSDSVVAMNILSSYVTTMAEDTVVSLAHRAKVECEQNLAEIKALRILLKSTLDKSDSFDEHCNHKSMRYEK